VGAFSEFASCYGKVLPERCEYYRNHMFPLAPELAHPDPDTPQTWWDALFPVLERAYVLPARVREDLVDPAQWRVFPDVLPALDGLSSRGWTHLGLSNHVPELSSKAGVSSRGAPANDQEEDGCTSQLPWRSVATPVTGLIVGKT
jgi:hypothetical protein